MLKTLFTLQLLFLLSISTPLISAENATDIRGEENDQKLINWLPKENEIEGQKCTTSLHPIPEERAKVALKKWTTKLPPIPEEQIDGEKWTTSLPPIREERLEVEGKKCTTLLPPIPEEKLTSVDVLESVSPTPVQVSSTKPHTKPQATCFNTTRHPGTTPHHPTTSHHTSRPPHTTKLPHTTSHHTTQTPHTTKLLHTTSHSQTTLHPRTTSHPVTAPNPRTISQSVTTPDPQPTKFHLSTANPYTPKPYPTPIPPRHLSMVLALRWPVALAKNKAVDLSKLKRYWTMHGIWPDSGSYCNPGYPFNETEVASIKSDLQTIWPNFHKYKSDSSFWEYEWNKHGTCTGWTIEEYFRKGWDLWNRYPVKQWLISAGIVPSHDASVTYFLTDIEAALLKGLGSLDSVVVKCQREWRGSSLWEIRICLDHTGDVLQQCIDWRSNCAHRIHYWDITPLVFAKNATDFRRAESDQELINALPKENEIEDRKWTTSLPPIPEEKLISDDVLESVSTSILPTPVQEVTAVTNSETEDDKEEELEPELPEEIEEEKCKLEGAPDSLPSHYNPPKCVNASKPKPRPKPAPKPRPKATKKPSRTPRPTKPHTRKPTTPRRPRTTRPPHTTRAHTTRHPRTTPHIRTTSHHTTRPPHTTKLPHTTSHHTTRTPHTTKLPHTTSHPQTTPHPHPQTTTSHPTTADPNTPKPYPTPIPGGQHPMVLALQWPVAFAKNKPNGVDQSKLKRHWTMHGVWPDSVSKCNPGYPFNETEVDSIKSDLQTLWPNFNKGKSDSDFWKHEWDEHGTCTGWTIEEYFSKGRDLWNRYPVKQWLDSAGIVPSPDASVTYNLTDIEAALQKGLGSSDSVAVNCLKKQLKGGVWDSWFWEIYICLDHSGDVLHKCAKGSNVNNCAHPIHYWDM